MGLIFLGGIHGSGKTYLLASKPQSLNLEILTASEILKWNDYSKQPNSKLVASIQNTQSRLVNNLSKITERNGKYLLNGHFCLLNKNKIIEKVPKETFDIISPKSLYLKVAEPSIISTRLQDRDKKLWSLKLIKDMQDMEISYARELSQFFNIELYIIQDNQEDYFWQLLQRDIEKW